MSNYAQGMVKALDMAAPNKPILIAYADYADESGYCWPGVETIAFDTGYSVPTVVRARRELIQGNWLRSKRRFGTSAGTRLNLPKIIANGVDRKEHTRIRPEFEFEDETPGQTQTDQSDLNEAAASPRTDQSDLYEEITLICTTDQSDHLSITDPSEDPSVEEERGNEGTPPEKEKSTPTPPAEWALRLVADLDYGKHRRPSRKQADQLARLVEAACTEHGLTQRDVLRHCRAALNGATKSGVAYLLGGLQVEHLPIPTATPPGHEAYAPRPVTGGEFIPAVSDELRANLRTNWRDLANQKR